MSKLMIGPILPGSPTRSSSGTRALSSETAPLCVPCKPIESIGSPIRRPGLSSDTRKNPLPSVVSVITM